jgi:hypothetical protein
LVGLLLATGSVEAHATSAPIAVNCETSRSPPLDVRSLVVLADTGSAALGPVVLVDGERTVMSVVERRVEEGNEVELVQAARVSAMTDTAITPSLRVVVIDLTGAGVRLSTRDHGRSCARGVPSGERSTRPWC